LYERESDLWLGLGFVRKEISNEFMGFWGGYGSGSIGLGNCKCEWSGTTKGYIAIYNYCQNVNLPP